MLTTYALTIKVDDHDKLIYEMQKRIHNLEVEVAELKSKVQTS
jgi:hypothetical protein